jgi:hypothetical protein
MRNSLKASLLPLLPKWKVRSQNRISKKLSLA